jgi:hypothetical protein
MKIISKKNLPNFLLPLSIYNSIYIADAFSKEGEEFDLLIGLERKYVEQLQQFSLNENDVDLQKNTGDKKRFGEGSYEDWYKKNRTPICLIHKSSDTLAALIWFGPESLFPGDEKNWHTAGWRSYKPFRGKGIMKNFIDFATDIYMQNVKNTEQNINLWVAIKRGNTASSGLASALGFQVLEEASDEVSLIMIK